MLVFGGSQGAFSLNSWFMDLLAELGDLKNWQVIHITGKNDYDRVRERYIKLKINSVVSPFLYPISLNAKC